jgi:hypothetical protein
VLHRVELAASERGLPSVQVAASRAEDFGSVGVIQ